MTERERLIKVGFIIPALAYLKLSKDDPKRVKYEMGLLLSGVEPYNYFNVQRGIH